MNDSNVSDCAAVIDVDSLLLSSGLLDGGCIILDGAAVRRLRQSRLLSQQDLANHCIRRRIRVSLPTIKRVECGGYSVRFRTALELARCFNVPLLHIVDAKVT